MISLGSSVRELQVIRQALKFFLNDPSWDEENGEEASVDEINNAIREVEFALMMAKWREEGDKWWREISKDFKYFKIKDIKDEEDD